jgi:hypothetical protein
MLSAKHFASYFELLAYRLRKSGAFWVKNTFNIVAIWGMTLCGIWIGEWIY